MRIDTTHRPWMLSALTLTGLAAFSYIHYAHGGAGSPRGGTPLGLTFGIAGYALMLYAALLGLRKKFPVRRLGRASAWMRGHLWLGYLSFPLILFHSGFAARGTLTGWLIILLTGTIVTGLLGAAVQHVVPRLMTRIVPLETIYEQIPTVRKQLQREADELVSSLSGVEAGRAARLWGAQPSGSGRFGLAETTADELQLLRQSYSATIRPFLADADRVKNECSTPERSAAFFVSLRRRLPESAHQVLADLENICDEERQLTRQKLIYRLLHSWLLAHVPLSLALVLLGGIHALVALRY